MIGQTVKLPPKSTFHYTTTVLIHEGLSSGVSPDVRNAVYTPRQPIKSKLRQAQLPIMMDRSEVRIFSGRKIKTR